MAGKDSKGEQVSILAQLEEQQSIGKKMFGIIAGPRLGGKTTLVGTLRGTTLMLQAAVLESGSESAKKLAANSDNQLVVVTFESIKQLTDILKELETDTRFDNLYLDGVSALTEMKDREPAVQRMKAKNIWDAYGAIGEATTEVLLLAKGLTYATTTKPKNVFVTCALEVSHDDKGSVNEVKLSAKGRVAVSQITKLGESVITVLPPLTTEEGTTGHRLITKTLSYFPGRIDGVLDAENPGVIQPANLQTVIDMVTQQGE